MHIRFTFVSFSDTIFYVFLETEMRPDKKSSSASLEDKLTILFAPMDAYGHFNCCIGMAEPLRDRGHNVVFATPNGWQGKLVSQGFKEEWYSYRTIETELAETVTQSDSFINVTERMATVLALSPQEQMEVFVPTILAPIKDMVINGEDQLREIVARTKPDVIVADIMFSQPALVNAGTTNH